MYGTGEDRAVGRAHRICLINADLLLYDLVLESLGGLSSVVLVLRLLKLSYI